MSIPAYEREPYRTSLETELVDRGDDGRPYVVLADTVFYPEGGGQPADRGRLGDVDVIDVQRVDGVLRHYVRGSIGDGPVALELDWNRRFDHMQQHTGQHLLTAVADDRFGWSTTAFHLGERVCDIELDTPDLTHAQIQELEEAVAAEIRAARPVRGTRVTVEAYEEMNVRSRGLPSGHVGDVRLVEIEGVDLNTCGGTHCASTAELGSLKLLHTESMRGGTRLFYVAGRRARSLLGEYHDRSAALRGVLGVSDAELVEAAQGRLDQLKAANRAVRQAEGAYAAALGVNWASRDGSVFVEHWSDKELPFLQSVARALLEERPDAVCFFTAGEGEGAFVLSAGVASEADVPALGARVAEILSGRGGGKGQTYQGRASDLGRRHEAASVLEETT